MIGIITPGNKKYTPYIQNYIDILNANKTEFKVMSWNKASLDEDGVDCSFDFPVKDSNRKKMLLGYIGFVRKCKRFIKKNRIDKLIILTAAPAFFLGINFLLKFKGNYILDIRDDSPLIRKFPNHFKNICKLAKSVVVSSDEFTPWTGRKTVLCHNVDLEQLRIHKNDAPANSFQTPIRIAFAGVMIEGKCNVDVLKQFKDDKRFEHYYIGRDSDGKQLIKDFVKKSNMSNVIFEGAYNKDEIIDIYRNCADLINIFRAETIVNRNALPNKLYEAVLSGRPVIVFEHNIAISKYAKKFHLGIVISNNNYGPVNDFIYKELNSFDYTQFRIGRKSFLLEIENDMSKFERIIYMLIIR